MNIQQLETFNWVAKLGSFTRAAERLNATQSTVSMRLAELERDLGTVLLDRSQRQVTLTPKGREVLRYANEAAQLFAEIRNVASPSRELQGSLRLGVAEVIATSWLPRFVQQVSRQFPGLDLDVNVDLSVSMMKALHSGHLDLVLSPVSNTESRRDVRITPLGDARFGFFCAPGFVDATTLCAQTLALVPIIVHGASSVLHDLTGDWLARQSVINPRIITCNSLSAARTLARARQGVAFLPVVHAASCDDPGAGLVELPTPFDVPVVKFGAMYLPEKSHALIETVAHLAAQSSDFDTH